MKILESIVYVIFHLIFFWGREIVQEGGDIFLPKVSAKFWVNFGNSKKFIKSATLTVAFCTRFRNMLYLLQ